MIDTGALQDAIITQLTAQIPDVSTYDFVSQDTAYPYIRIESLNATDAGTKDIDFYSYDVTISVYYNVPAAGGTIGKDPVFVIMKRIAAALQNQPDVLVMNGSAAITLRLAYETCLQEDNQPEGTVFHGVQRYETLIQTS